MGLEKECLEDIPKSYFDLKRAKGSHPCIRKGYVPLVTGWETLDKRCKKIIASNDEIHLQSYEIVADAISSTKLEMSEETEYLVKLTENILTFVRLLCRSKTKSDYMFAITVFVQCRSDKSIMSLLMDKWNTIVLPT